MNTIIMFVILLAVVLNLFTLAECVWMTHEIFFENYQIHLSNIIEIHGQPCPENMKRINLGECRRTY